MIQLHANDTAREAKPGFWIFQGKVVVWFVVGFGAAVCLFQLLVKCDVDWFIAAPIASLPLLFATLFVHLLVNNKPPSYAEDLLLVLILRGKVRLYEHGLIVQPPKMWVEDRNPVHPKEY